MKPFRQTLLLGGAAFVFLLATPFAYAEKKREAAASGKSTTEANAKAGAAVGPTLPNAWTAADIEGGLQDCSRRLSGLHVIYDKLTPLKEGACGLPSPIRLKAFETGGAPTLQLLPEPIVSCKMTEGLRHWFDDIVQRSAKAHLDAAIIRIGSLSAYMCRSRYDDPSQRISEHAYANALDVSEFVTAKGEHIAVLDHWGGSDERAAFLREVHDGACKIFGTTLGPDANEAHKNHFHLDMKERRHPLCDFAPGQKR